MPARMMERRLSTAGRVNDWKRRLSIWPRTSRMVLISSVSFTEKAFSNCVVREGTTSERRA